MIIRDHKGEKIEACLQMPYRGWQISLTTIFNQPEIAIVNPAGVLQSATFIGTVAGFIRAQAHIDRELYRATTPERDRLW